MQQVTEIYGRENGWIDSARHSEHQIHPPPQVLEARVVAGDGYAAALINFRLIANAVMTTAEVEQALIHAPLVGLFSRDATDEPVTLAPGESR